MNGFRLYKQRKNSRPQRRARGMSLLELMIALLLSSTLLAGVVGVFVSMFQSDRTQEGVALIQETGRFALNFLTQDIRMAGYLGCSSAIDRGEINNMLNSPPTNFQPSRNVQGWEADGSDPAVIKNLTANAAVASTASGYSTSGGSILEATMALPGTDIIRVWHADPEIDVAVNLVQVIAAASRVNVPTGSVSVPNGTIMFLSDCEHADWVQVCTSVAVTGPPATLDLKLGSPTGCSPGNIASDPFLVANSGVRVMKLSGTVYFIGKRGNVATNPPALFRRVLDVDATAATAEELVEGVEDMQILYGENTNNDDNNAADRFVPADNVTNWDNVVSVRITLLVRSAENNLVPAAQPYTYNGIDYTGASGKGALPPDRRLRRVFTTTINLRNVTLGG